MATYLEIRSLTRDEILRQKVEAAIMIAANTIKDELPATTNHANRLVWAKQAFANSVSKVSSMLAAVLAANSEATLEQIQSAADATIQSNVNDAIDVFADGSL